MALTELAPKFGTHYITEFDDRNDILAVVAFFLRSQKRGMSTNVIGEWMPHLYVFVVFLMEFYDQRQQKTIGMKESTRIIK